MKYALTLILAWLSFSCYCQTSNEALIKDASGNVVGRVSTYTNYTGRTESTLYDRNGHVLGSVQGANCGSLLGTHFTGSYTIVGDGNTSNVVLGSGTQALDYYLAVSQSNTNRSVSPSFIHKMNKKYAEPEISENPENVSHPEYLSINESQKNKIIKTETKMRRHGDREELILTKKLEMLEAYMVKRNVLPVMRKERLKDMKKYHNSAKIVQQ